MRDSEIRSLPKAVYYQCVWIVKDIDRLFRLEAMQKHGRRDDELIIFEDEDARIMKNEVIEQAVWKLACIRESIDMIPEEYRLDVLDGIVYGERPSDIAHENTWKKWRRIFINELAYKLNLI